MNQRHFISYLVIALLIVLALLVGISAASPAQGAVELGLMLAAESEEAAFAPQTADTTVVAAFVLAISATAAIIITKKR